MATLGFNWMAVSERLSLRGYIPISIDRLASG
jgi:hypothetical protein